MIVVPYVPGRLESRTAQWAVRVGAMVVDVSDHDRAYFDLLDDLWRGLPEGESLTVVEHDVIPDDAAWPGLQDCHENWCVQPYPISNGASVCGDCLGCVRWSGRLRALLPDLFGHISRITVGSVPATSWKVLDIYVKRELSCRGQRVHPHGRATHLHVYDD